MRSPYSAEGYEFDPVRGRIRFLYFPGLHPAQFTFAPFGDGHDSEDEKQDNAARYPCGTANT